MDRTEFMAKLAPLDQERMRKVLWNLYWRGSAAMRERIEAEIDAEPGALRRHQAKEPVDPDCVLDEVREFVALARSGAYIGGDRRVSRHERSRWRLTFQRLVADAQEALLSPEGIEAGAAALEQVIDLACDMRDREYFHSEDPVEAARFVVSDAVARLWSSQLSSYGFDKFAERAAPQLIRWESRYGWTPTGFGATSEKETSLARVIAGMLRTPEMWFGFADSYVAALDQVARDEAAKPRRDRPYPDRDRERTAELAEWHGLLLDKLVKYRMQDRLDLLIRHPALAGAELTFLQARLAYQRGEVEAARGLVHSSLATLPGHQGFLDFAVEIGAPLPSPAQRILKELSSSTMGSVPAGDRMAGA